MHDEHEDDEDDEHEDDEDVVQTRFTSAPGWWWGLISEREPTLTPEAFDAAANDPGRWSLRSMHFFRAAVVVLRAEDDYHERQPPLQLGERRALEFADMMLPALTLAAVAIENLVKGLIAERGEAAANGKLTKKAATHKLTDLATSADVSLDAREIELLRQLTYFAGSEGRFPTGLKSDDGAAKMLGMSGTFAADLASVYFKLADTLCERTGDAIMHAHLYRKLKIFAGVLPPRE